MKASSVGVSGRWWRMWMRSSGGRGRDWFVWEVRLGLVLERAWGGKEYWGRERGWGW